MTELTHLDAEGRVQMVDVGNKAASVRRAVASGCVQCQTATLAMVREGRTPKGAVITTAELAGIMAAKRTHELIPLCHPLALSKVAVIIEMDNDLPGFRLTAEARLTGQTGVEMEALTAVSVAALTLYDMLKAVDKGIVIQTIRLDEKSGGKSGGWASGSTVS
ncbi:MULTISPECIES: cyclic pyranopterin monophosphate synthase MoaC [unclassified Hyphomonas]|uniref:cyclic pyranopterin monophosphate synthase MoaC n=1 Tax=unclassified Hyphomonas TaxID=2630699 RepID=UPI000458DCDF|nr:MULTISPECIES: cyclic pyranopterin monophosphate synthase MoaC [unclassified Hyphomonas]KCZ46697.1 molybdenum cofactor biosynthesis protein MoaC [Hyphomonas sp. CY54-11-8]